MIQYQYFLLLCTFAYKYCICGRFVGVGRTCWRHDTSSSRSASRFRVHENCKCIFFIVQSMFSSHIFILVYITDCCITDWILKIFFKLCLLCGINFENYSNRPNISMFLGFPPLTSINTILYMFKNVDYVYFIYVFQYTS